MSGRASGLALLLLGGVISATAANPMVVLKSRYELRMGEPAEIPAAADTLDFLVHAKSVRATAGGQDVPGLVVGPNETKDGMMLAAASEAIPGEYAVTLTATGANGEERETTMDVVVQPRATVPNGSTRAPVVLLNGWISGFNNSCPIATSSQTTFGNLAQYLISDGVPVVYLFDNCAEDPNQSIETLGNDLANFLQTIKYADGTQVQQIDLVAHSMGGLIARAYLSGLQPGLTYTPPTNTLVHNLVLIATPNFGSFVAGNYTTALIAGSQNAELEPGSALLWNLATWNERSDDLHGVSAIAIAGNAGNYQPGLSSSTQLVNASDGLVSLTSASLGFVSQQSSGVVSQQTTLTRVVPYCHVDPSAFINTLLGALNCNAAGIANVTSTSHLTGQIVRSFLAGTTDWQSIGNSPSQDAYLSTNGATFFAMQTSASAYVTDLSSVTWGNVALTPGGNLGTIFYTDFVTGSGDYTAVSSSLGTWNCGTVGASVGYTAATRCKIGSAITSVTPPSAGNLGLTLTAGTAITVNGHFVSPRCSNCRVSVIAAGSTTAQALTISSWSSSAIVAQLPANLSGYYTLSLSDAAGNDTVGIIVVGQATIALDSTSEQFAYTVGGALPAAQTFNVTNSGNGTLAWTATVSQTGSWLSVSPTSGTAPTAVTVTVSPAILSPGTYTGTIQIAATGASNSPMTVNVTLVVSGAPSSLVVSPQTLIFSYTAGAAAPAPQALSISNSSGAPLSWVASSSNNWVVVTPSTGTAPGSASVSAGNLAAGTYNATVTIAAADNSVAPVQVPVTFTVQSAPPAPAVTAVVNAASFQPGIAAAAWVAIGGSNLSQIIYSWQGSDFVNSALPTSLGGVSVTINGIPAYVSYISPTQINVLAPDDATTGQVQVQVTVAGQSSAFTAQKSAFAPTMFTFGGTYVAAQHLDYSLIGKPGLLQGATTTPAQPGETIILYGTGFGPTNPPVPTGQLVSTAEPLANTVQFTIGGTAVTPSFSGLTNSGLYQFNLTVPNLPNGDAAVGATIGGVSTPTGVLVTVQQ